jgi:hypothetical protein
LFSIAHLLWDGQKNAAFFCHLLPVRPHDL